VLAGVSDQIAEQLQRKERVFLQASDDTIPGEGSNENKFC
jgi:hypothetical protein